MGIATTEYFELEREKLTKGFVPLCKLVNSTRAGDMHIAQYAQRGLSDFKIKNYNVFSNYYLVI